MYELPYELPNELRPIPTALSPPGGRWCPHKKKKTQGLRKLGNIRKVSKLPRMIAPCPLPRQNENLANSNKKLLKNKN